MKILSTGKFSLDNSLNKVYHECQKTTLHFWMCCLPIIYRWDTIIYTFMLLCRTKSNINLTRILLHYGTNYVFSLFLFFLAWFLSKVLVRFSIFHTIKLVVTICSFWFVFLLCLQLLFQELVISSQIWS